MHPALAPISIDLSQLLLYGLFGAFLLAVLCLTFVRLPWDDARDRDGRSDGGE